MNVLCSPTLNQISFKFLWESGFYKFWPKSKWREIKIGYLAAILKRYNIFIFFAELWIFIAHTYMVQISLQNFGGKVVLYGWVARSPPPWAPTGVKVPWSLKCLYLKFTYTSSTASNYVYLLFLKENRYVLCGKIASFILEQCGCTGHTIVLWGINNLSLSK